jgi:hypothetical protein
MGAAAFNKVVNHMGCCCRAAPVAGCVNHTAALTAVYDTRYHIGEFFEIGLFCRFG